MLDNYYKPLNDAHGNTIYYYYIDGAMLNKIHKRHLKGLKFSSSTTKKDAQEKMFPSSRVKLKPERM